jgi:hypothetical protein
MIACVLVFSAYFFVANKRQRAGKTVIEGTVRKVVEDQTIIEANMITGRFPAYILRIDLEKLDTRRNHVMDFPNQPNHCQNNRVKSTCSVFFSPMYCDLAASHYNHGFRFVTVTGYFKVVSTR